MWFYASDRESCEAILNSFCDTYHEKHDQYSLPSCSGLPSNLTGSNFDGCKSIGLHPSSPSPISGKLLLSLILLKNKWFCCLNLSVSSIYVSCCLTYCPCNHLMLHIFRTRCPAVVNSHTVPIERSNRILDPWVIFLIVFLAWCEIG